MTLEELARERRAVLPAEVVFRLLGCGRTAGYAHVRCGDFPLRAIRVGRKVVFSTVEVRRALGLEPERPA
ncbi:MAG TPA: DNA-binding protein [Thermodesulfobacteriota bacterium]